MLVPFESLDVNSKIWIYQSDSKLQQNELEFVRKNTEAFLTEWTAHGQNLQAGMQMALVTCIDFTASNGAPSNANSLHYTTPLNITS